MRSKHLLLMLLLALMAPWAANAQVQIGGGTTTSSYLPSNSLYNYSISQQIYTAAEIGASGNITSIAFYNGGSEKSRKYDIYMAHTTKTGFEASSSTTKDWIALTDANRVYQGTEAVALAAGEWTTFTLSTPFNYNGTSNLVVCMIDRSGTWSSGLACRVFSTGTDVYQAIYITGDGLDDLHPDGTNGNTAQTYTRLTSKNQIILGGIQQSCAKPTNLTATLTPGNGTIATLSWTENGNADSWKLQYGTNSEFTAGSYTEVNVTEGNPTKNLSGLTPETTYYARVKPDCDTEGTKWSDAISFTPTNTYNITVNDGTTTNSVVPVYGLWVDNKSYSQFIIPAASLESIQWGTINKMTFYSSNSSVSWPNAKFEVYMTETAATTLSALADWGTMEKVMNEAHLEISDDKMVVTLDAPYQYLGENLMIGIKQTVSGTYGSASFYGIEATGASMGGYGTAVSQQNFLPKTTFAYTPGVAPSCLRPSGLTVGEVTNHTAEISWTPAEGQTAWHVYKSKNNVAPADDIALSEVIDVSTTPAHTLTGLDAETTYYVWVRGNCGVDDYSVWVGPQSFTTEIACPAPTELTVSNIGSSSAQLSWAGSASSYGLEYAKYNATDNALWLKYDNETVTSDVGNNTLYTWVWGVMYPASMLNNNGLLCKVAFYETAYYSEGAPITIYIASGGSTEPETFLYSETVSCTGVVGVHEVMLQVPIAIDPTKNLWIILQSTTITRPMAMCNVNEANGRWVYNGGTWSDISTSLATVAEKSFMIRGYVDNVDLVWNTETDVTSPFTITNLDSESGYFARVKSVCGGIDGESAWAGTFFTTLTSCPTPADLAANNITQNTANITWTGSPDVDDYTVQYRTAAYINGVSEEFSTSLPTDWCMYTGKFDESTGKAPLTSSTYAWAFGEGNGVFDNHARVNIYSNNQRWLVTPRFEVTSDALTFDMALTAYSGNLAAPATTGTDDKFIVLVSTADDITAATATWTVLRKWDNETGSTYVYNNIACTATGQHVNLDMTDFVGQNVYVAFYGESTESNADNNLHIDNVLCGTSIPEGPWTDAATDVVNQYYDFADLTPGKKYEVKVKSNCTGGGYCEPISFTTLAEGNKVFTNASADGKWNTAANWAPTGAPSITDNAIIRANVTIDNGTVATAKKITFEGSTTPTLTINDGGQLQTNNTVTATVKKSIAAYGESAGGYYLIANPLNSSFSPGVVNGFIAAVPANYDLYSWSTSTTENYLEWRNYKASSFSLSNGKGYLYANKLGTTLTFTGPVKANNTPVTSSALSFTASGTVPEFNGWNLLGNPFVCNASLTFTEGENPASLAYYRMNGAGTGFEASTDPIAPMEGVFVKATASGQKVKFSRTAPVTSPSNLYINLAQTVSTRDAVPATDNAIINFGNINPLEKFSFREGSTKVYIPMDGKDYAVVNAEKQGELPLNFKAENNGSYTLSFSNENVEFGYLHLIDNMTGMDVDLLQNPSYSFEAKTTDYASRFKLVFSTGNGVNEESFAFISDGNIILNGEGMLQVVDVMGRIMMQEENATSVSTSGMTPGVYVLRLINGDSVRTQKIVVK